MPGTGQLRQAVRRQPDPVRPRRDLVDVDASSVFDVCGGARHHLLLLEGPTPDPRSPSRRRILEALLAQYAVDIAIHDVPATEPTLHRTLQRPFPLMRPLQNQRVTSTHDQVDELLQFPDVHPYRKFWGTHWRLVELADLGTSIPPVRLQAGIDQEVAWLSSSVGAPAGWSVDRRPRRHASMHGNAVYALSRLGFAHHPSTRRLVEALIEWQWPDGGWNCDRHRTAHRSSFHESVTPALGLATYADLTGDAAAFGAADRTAELLLQHRLFRVHGTGGPIHPSWTKLHYPPYWHYDVLQGLRLLRAVDRLNDHRASDALDLLESSRRPDGTFSGPQWSSNKQPGVLDRGTYSQMLTRRAQEILEASGR